VVLAVRGRIAALALAAAWLAASASARAAAEPPAPPSIPGGVADASGTLGYFAVNDGTIVAVDLATGQRRWTTRQGRWPLAARAAWLAVVAPDGAQRNTLHVRFLRPADGKLLVDAPIRFPDGIVVGADGDLVDSEVVIGSHNASLTLSPDMTAGKLRVTWTAQSWIPSGFRPSPVQRVSGVALVNPVNGAVELRSAEPTPPPAPPELPPGFKPVRGTIYWSFSRWGANWGDRPTLFRISPGVTAFFSYESRPVRRLILNRWQNGAPHQPLEVASGDEYAPLVSPDGRHMVLTSGVAERPVITLYDLSRAGATPLPMPARLPPLDMKFRPPFAVIGPRLYFVAETDGEMGPAGATIFQRRVMALEWTSGRVSWAFPLKPRVLPAPTPGAR
jgi:hypothetical protein